MAKSKNLLVQHVISQFMKDQLNGLKEGKGEANNSFVFLENSTLNMLITLSVDERKKSNA